MSLSMFARRFGIVFAGLTFGFVSLAAPVMINAEVAATKIGRKVSSFELKTHRGLDVALASIDEPIVVLTFLGTECPLVKLYGPRFERIAKRVWRQGRSFFWR